VRFFPVILSFCYIIVEKGLFLMTDEVGDEAAIPFPLRAFSGAFPRTPSSLISAWPMRPAPISEPYDRAFPLLAGPLSRMHCKPSRNLF